MQQKIKNHVKCVKFNTKPYIDITNQNKMWHAPYTQFNELFNFWYTFHYYYFDTLKQIGSPEL